MILAKQSPMPLYICSAFGLVASFWSLLCIVSRG
jgi:hypothetical protein